VFVIVGILILIICMLVGFIKIIKDIKKEEWGFFKGIKIILFGWMFLTWICWIDRQSLKEMSIIIPIVFTILFIATIIIHKILKGYNLKQNIIKEHNKEKEKQWDVNESEK